MKVIKLNCVWFEDYKNLVWVKWVEGMRIWFSSSSSPHFLTLKACVLYMFYSFFHVLTSNHHFFLGFLFHKRTSKHTITAFTYWFVVRFSLVLRSWFIRFHVACIIWSLRVIQRAPGISASFIDGIVDNNLKCENRTIVIDTKYIILICECAEICIQRKLMLIVWYFYPICFSVALVWSWRGPWPWALLK